MFGGFSEIKKSHSLKVSLFNLQKYAKKHSTLYIVLFLLKLSGKSSREDNFLSPAYLFFILKKF